MTSSNINTGYEHPINKPIEVSFNKPIDLDSVNLSSFSITPLPPASDGAPQAGPASGLFFLKPGSEGQTVVFQPNCPTDQQFQNGGLVPGNTFGPVIYAVTIAPGGSNAIGSTDGSKLGKSFTITFRTPSPPSSPLEDPNPGSPPMVMGAETLPSALSMNLLIHPLDPIQVILDQPVLPYTIDDQSLRLEFTDPNTQQTVKVPGKTSLIQNCNEKAQSILLFTPVGVLPPGQILSFILSKNVRGFGFQDNSFSDLSFHQATVEEVRASPQRDAILEEFDSDQMLDPGALLNTPVASWSGGRLEGAPLLPMEGFQDVEVEIGPFTTNGRSVRFSTDGSTLRDKSGKDLIFPNGVISVRKFTIKSPLQGQVSEFLGVGSNPLIIRCTDSFTVETGGRISASGDSAQEIIALCSATQPPVANGLGNCGGGNGGQSSELIFGSPSSGTVGRNGQGPFGIPDGGGRGGDSGYWTSMPADMWKNCGSLNDGEFPNFYHVRPGGGGGGDWSILERISGLYGTYCYSKTTTPCTNTFPPYCVYPLNSCPSNSQITDCKGGAPNNTRGEQGAWGVNSSTDVITRTIPALGGAPGPAVFTDNMPGNNPALPSNDFYGKKPIGNSIMVGELGTVLGGEGGGAGGDGIYTNFLPPPFNNLAAIRGGYGGGGGGILWVQSLGPLTVLGKVEANGGDGGRGELIVSYTGNPPQHHPGGGGGGGGAGGMILLESATAIQIGKDAVVQALGGDRSYGAGQMNNWNSYFSDCSLPGIGGNQECKKNCVASHGGAGGKGLIQLHVPFDPDAAKQSCDEIGTGDDLAIRAGALKVDPGSGYQNIFCERDPLLLGSTTKHFDPAPHVLIPNIGAQSGARSRWYYTGFANTVSPPVFEFGGLDSQGNVDSSFTQVLTSGSQYSVVEGAIRVESASLAEAISSEPRTLIGDSVVLGNQKSFTITGASVSGNSVTVLLDPKDGAPGFVNDWKITRNFFVPLVDGQRSSFPNSARARLRFEGADENPPGSMLPTAIVGPTTDFAALKGKKMIRFTVDFERNVSSGTVGPTLPNPGFERIKIPYSF